MSCRTAEPDRISPCKAACVPRVLLVSLRIVTTPVTASFTFMMGLVAILLADSVVPPVSVCVT